MKMSNKYQLAVFAGCTSLLVSCATPQTNSGVNPEIEQKMAELEKQEQALQEQKAALDKKEQELAVGSALLASNSAMSSIATSPLFPPNAKPGECYARVFIPPTYETVTETMLKAAESEKVEIIPATYKTVEKKILVSEESSRRLEIPAEYKTQTERVEVHPQQLVWRTALSQKSPEASQTLLDTAQKYGIDLSAAQPGQCFHEHYVPPIYKKVASEELIAEESAKVEAIPAQYEMVEEQVLVREASTKLIDVPATYKWTEEQVLVKDAHTEWKKGSGLIERVDNNTGEIMCLVEIPAEYKTVRKRVIDQPSHTVTKEIPAVYKTVKVRKMITPASEKKIVIPAKYKTVYNKEMVQEGHSVWHEIHNKQLSKESRTGQQICLVENPAEYRSVSKRVVVTPARTELETIPAVYKTIRVKVVDQDAQERKITIPAEYQQITKQKKITEGRMEWRNVLCETNTTVDFVRTLQSALYEAGYDPGPIDGNFGGSTAFALKKYQKDNGLASGGLTFETLKSLGLR